MLPFIAIVAFALAGINMGFKQGQANPDAANFFESKSSAVK
jgi:hypothetical protein